jgi:hypothetical protein
VWDALVVQASRDGEWWRLPFPAAFGGGDAKDFLTWLAPYAALVVLALAVFRFKRTAGPFVLGAGAAVYYASRADLEHAQGLLVVAAALAALIRPKLFGAAVLALLLAVGTANRASALLRPPDLKPFEGVRIPAEDADALPRVIALVHELVPPGEPIYVAPRRSDLVSFTNPLLHYLTGRPNVLRRDVLLQAKPQEQARIVAALERAKPKAIVRWTAPESAKPEPNRRGRPSGSRALDDYLAAAYEPRARYGDYEILVPRYEARVFARILLVALTLTAGGWLAVQARAARAEQGLTKIAFENGNLADAKRLLAADRRLNPDHRADLFEAVILGRQGDFRGAVVAIQRVTRAEPENIEAWGLLASAAKRSDPALAAEAGARARELSPPVR